MTIPARSPLAALNVSGISPSPDNPRTHMDPVALQELAQSIMAQGLLEPVIVRPSEPADPPDIQAKPWVLIAGHRRLAAHELLHLKQIAALIHEEITRQTALPLTLVENLQREDLGPLEEAQGYRDTMAVTGYTQAQLAAKLGKSQPAIGNALRLLQLPAAVKRQLNDGQLSAGHGRALMRFKDHPEVQECLGAMAAENDWAVRALENITDSEILELTGIDIRPARPPAAPALISCLPDEPFIDEPFGDDRGIPYNPSDPVHVLLADEILGDAAPSKMPALAPQEPKNAPAAPEPPVHTAPTHTAALAIVYSDSQLAARAERRRHLAWCKDLSNRALDKLSTVRALGPRELTLIVGALSRSRGRLPIAWGEPGDIPVTRPAMLRLGLLTAAILADLKAQRKDPNPDRCFTAWWLDGRESRSEETSHR